MPESPSPSSPEEVASEAVGESVSGEAEVTEAVGVVEAGEAPLEVFEVEGDRFELVRGGKKKTFLSEGGAAVVRCNIERYASEAAALWEGVCSLAFHQSLHHEDLTQRAKVEGLDLSEGKLEEVFVWRGLQNVILEYPDLEDRLRGYRPAMDVPSQVFLWACRYHAIFGEFPDDLPEQVAGRCQGLPSGPKGHAIDILKDENYPVGPLSRDDTALDNYQKYVQPCYNQLRAFDPEPPKTDTTRYSPQRSGEQDDAEQKEIEEDDITVYVEYSERFKKDYFRQYVCHYDPDEEEIVDEECDAELFEPAEDELDFSGLQRATYHSVFPAGKTKIALELPGDAFPWIHTLAPSGRFKIHRAVRGKAFYLFASPAVEEAVSFSFDYVKKETAHNRIDDPPESRDREAIGAPLDSDTEAFLEQMRSANHLSDGEKAVRAMRYVRKKFAYPSKEQEGPMDMEYKGQKRKVFEVMGERNIANCYWSNLFFGEMCHQLGIAQRVIAGDCVESADPRWPQRAIVRADGTDGHAWSEVWVGSRWERLDATPPGESEEGSEEEASPGEAGEEGEETSAADDDFDAHLHDLEPREVEELYDEETIQERREEWRGKSGDDEKMRNDQFQKMEGITPVRWEPIENLIHEINQIPLPPSERAFFEQAQSQGLISTIPLTISEAYFTIFELIQIRRKRSEMALKSPVRFRKSTGEIADAGLVLIDLVGLEEDPNGFIRRYEREVLRKEPRRINFSHIFDCTWSMGEPSVDGAIPFEEQRKSLIVGLYHLMEFSERLRGSDFTTDVHTALELGSWSGCFLGDHNKKIFMTQKDIITKKIICEAYEELGKLQAGAGDLVGMLKEYEKSLDGELLESIAAQNLIEILTIYTDGAVGDAWGSDKWDAIQIIQRLRQKGVIVQGIGYGEYAQDILPLCGQAALHDETVVDLTDISAVIINDVRQAATMQFRMIAKHLACLAL